MRLVFAGTPEPAAVALRALLASSHEVVAVVTRPDARAGRGRGLRPSPVRAVAQEAGLPVLTPSSTRDPQFQGELAALEPDACPVVAYGALIPPDVLAIPRHGWVNLHFSLLPAWRGAAPVQAAIAAGDEMTGAATFLIEPALDTGPVYGVVTERIRDDDTAGDLLARLADSGARLLTATMDGIEVGTLTAVPQSGDGVSYAEKITVEGARVNWAHPAQAVDRHVRSVTPDPGAWTMLGGTRLKLGPVTVDPERSLEPGRVEATKKEVHVGTATDAVRLSQVQAPGKKPMRAADWARGARLTGEEAFA